MSWPVTWYHGGPLLYSSLVRRSLGGRVRWVGGGRHMSPPAGRNIRNDVLNLVYYIDFESSGSALNMIVESVQVYNPDFSTSISVATDSRSLVVRSAPHSSS